MNTGSYIDGKWFHPKSERLVRNINPADLDDVIAEFPAATSQDAHRAIEAAQAAFKGLEEDAWTRAWPRPLARGRYRAPAR